MDWTSSRVCWSDYQCHRGKGISLIEGWSANHFYQGRVVITPSSGLLAVA